MAYWTDRQKQLYAGLEKDEAEIKKRLNAIYTAEANRLDKDIASYYQKYGVDGVIEYRTLMQKLSDNDVTLLMQDMDEFAKKYPQYEHLLPIRESIYKLNRLEGLQQSLMLHQYKMGAVNAETLTAYFNKQALRGVNTAAEVMGFGKSFYSEGAEILKKFVDTPWCNGKNFSERIWNDTEKLSNYLVTDLAQGIARGDNYKKLTAALQKRFLDVNRNDAYRLVYTEGTYIMAESTIQPFTQDFEEYRVSTVGDGKVCSVCSGVAKEAFRIEDRKPGVNFPPFHPWCRCTFEIVVKDWDKWLDEYEHKHGTDSAEKVLNNFDENGIISAKSRSNYDPVTYNPNASFRISLENYPQAVNNGLSEACATVARLGALDNNEHLILVDLTTGNSVYSEIGTFDSVGGTKFWEYLKNNKDKSFAFVHNHNTASEFSETDMQTLLLDNPVNMFVISRLDGKCFVVEKKSTPPKSFFDSLYPEEIKALTNKLKKGEIDGAERTRLREELLVSNVIRDYSMGGKKIWIIIGQRLL